VEAPVVKLVEHIERELEVLAEYAVSGRRRVDPRDRLPVLRWGIAKELE